MASSRPEPRPPADHGQRALQRGQAAWPRARVLFCSAVLWSASALVSASAGASAATSAGASAGANAAGANAGASPAACSTASDVRPADVLLTVQVTGGAPLGLGAAELAMLKASRLTQRQLVSSAASAASDRSTVYGGVLLRDVLLRAGFGAPSDRAARAGVVEAVATDGYRACFSWGERFNSALGEQVLVIVEQDGQPLGSDAGPLALRSLADIRPGSRPVRKLCAVFVRR